MSSDRQQRLEDLFHAALEVPAAQRMEFLENECDDAELRAEVLELLDADSRQGQTMLPFEGARWIDDLPPLETSSSQIDTANTGGPSGERDAEQALPEQIGRYRILSYVAEGGMGIVYRAEQQHPRRVVALKVIRPDFATPQTLRRFEYEASVLGRLQHPGIAQIHEAGTTTSERGRTIAFFAMEFIAGRPLTEHAGAARLDVRARLALLARVCDAVDHAHRNGVIHRDLKPANILVDTDGNPKVLDFGVARAIEGDLKQTQAHTMAGQLVGTVPYMSPEQIAGDPNLIDTRCDVYALGVILFELLSGELPYDLRERSLLDAARIIQEQPPTNLGTRLPHLRGDIATIAAKALEKQREQRYNSAAALADDLRRYLENEPILARPPSVVYQLRKFTQRHKLLVASGLSIVALLIAGVIGIGWQYLRAEQARERADQERREALLARDAAEEAEAAEKLQRRRAEDNQKVAQLEAENARRVTRFLVNMLIAADPRRALGENVRVIDALDAAAARLERGAAAMDPAVEAELRLAIGRTYLQLGNLTRCEPHLETAVQRCEAARPYRPDQVASACSYLAELRVRQQRFDEAETLLRRATVLLGEVLPPNDPQVIDNLNNYATLLRQREQLDAAAEAYRDLLTRVGDAPELEGQRISIARNLGAVLWELSRFEESATLFEAVLAIQRRRLPGRHPQIATTLASLGYVRTELGRHDQAMAALDEALSIQREVLAPGHFQIGATQTLRGASLLAGGAFAEAEAALRESLKIRRDSLPPNHWQIANVESLLGAALSHQGSAAEAEHLLLGSWEALAANPATPAARLRDAARRLATHFDLSDQPERAQTWRDRAALSD